MRNFDVVEAFLAVEQHGSIYAASQSLKISQPSVSRQIQSLEADVGADLFLRKREGAVLTEAGRRFHAEIIPIYKELREKIKTFNNSTIHLTGQCHIGVPVEFGQRVLLPELMNFQKLHPELELRVQLLPRQRILEYIEEGRLGLGISTRPSKSALFNSYPLYEETFVLVTRSENPKDFHECESPVLVRYRFDDPFLDDYLDAIDCEGKTIKTAITINSQSAMIECLGRYDSYAVLPRHSAEKPFAEKLLRVAAPLELANTLYVVVPAIRRTERKYVELRKFLTTAWSKA